MKSSSKNNLRIALADRQGGWYCFYCKRKLIIPQYSSSQEEHQHALWPQIEHKIPTCRGGTDTLDNLTLACRSCNTYKHSLTADEFISKLESITRYAAWCPPDALAIIPPGSIYADRLAQYHE